MERIVSIRLDTYHGDGDYTENEMTGTWTADIEYFGRNWEDVFQDVRETVREWVGKKQLSRGWYVDGGTEYRIITGPTATLKQTGVEI